eukprot:tig00021319_g20255.t1
MDGMQGSHPPDLDLIADIIRDAERASAGSKVTLNRILHSYDKIFRARGADPAADSKVYRHILKMSLDAGDWNQKLAALRSSTMQARGDDHLNGASPFTSRTAEPVAAAPTNLDASFCSGVALRERPRALGDA